MENVFYQWENPKTLIVYAIVSLQNLVLGLKPEAGLLIWTMQNPRAWGMGDWIENALPTPLFLADIKKIPSIFCLRAPGSCDEYWDTFFCSLYPFIGAGYPCLANPRQTLGFWYRPGNSLSHQLRLCILFEHLVNEIRVLLKSSPFSFHMKFRGKTNPLT